MQLDQVWYATPARAGSRTKWLVYDDVGTLSLDDAHFSFRGSKVTVDARAIESVDLTRQRINFVTYLLVCGLAFPVYFGAGYAVQLLFGVPWLVTLLVCYSVVPIGLAIGFSTRWVRVQYLSASGQRDVAYFADGGSQGWRGILGGTRRMFDDIRARCMLQV